MNQEWHYTRNAQVYGPVSAGELKRLAQSGALKPTDSVRRANMDRWVTASQIRGLVWPAERVATPPQPAPRQPVSAPPPSSPSPVSQPRPTPPTTGGPTIPPSTPQWPVVVSSPQPGVLSQGKQAGHSALRLPIILGIFQLVGNVIVIVIEREKYPTLQTEVTAIGAGLSLIILTCVIAMLLRQRWGALVLGILNILGALCWAIQAISVGSSSGGLGFAMSLIKIVILGGFARAYFEGFSRARPGQREASASAARADGHASSRLQGTMTVAELEAHYKTLQTQMLKCLAWFFVSASLVIPLGVLFLIIGDDVFRHPVVALSLLAATVALFFGGLAVFGVKARAAAKRYSPKCPQCQQILYGYHRRKLLKSGKCPYCAAIILS